MAKKIVTLASGTGINFKALLEALAEGQIPDAQMAALITDRKGTGAVDLAKKFRVPFYEIDYKSFSGREAYNAELQRVTTSLSPDLIMALGYMRILPGEFVNAYHHRLINVHPSLLPSFPGLDAQRQALEYGVRITGVTVHYVDDGVDTGPIILQSPVKIPPGVEVDELADLIRVEEHRLIVEAARLHIQKRLKVEGRQVIITE